jgi:hypothetical protein
MIRSKRGQIVDCIQGIQIRRVNHNCGSQKLAGDVKYTHPHPTGVPGERMMWRNFQTFRYLQRHRDYDNQSMRSRSSCHLGKVQNTGMHDAVSG